MCSAQKTKPSMILFKDHSLVVTWCDLMIFQLVLYNTPSSLLFALGCDRNTRMGGQLSTAVYYISPKADKYLRDGRQPPQDSPTKSDHNASIQDDN